MPYLITFLLFTFSIVPTNGYSVTQNPQEVSYYMLAHNNEGADVILAHQSKAGVAFNELRAGDLIQVGYPDGMRLYSVTEIQRYTATDGLSVHSYFIDDATGRKLSSSELVEYLYIPDRLVLQTCYGSGAGRLFVIADPIILDGGRKAGR